MLGRFSAMTTKRINFCDFLSALLNIQNQKGPYPKGNVLQMISFRVDLFQKEISFRVDLFQKGDFKILTTLPSLKAYSFR